MAGHSPDPDFTRNTSMPSYRTDESLRQKMLVQDVILGEAISEAQFFSQPSSGCALLKSRKRIQHAPDNGSDLTLSLQALCLERPQKRQRWMLPCNEGRACVSEMNEIHPLKECDAGDTNKSQTSTDTVVGESLRPPPSVKEFSQIAGITKSEREDIDIRNFFSQPIRSVAHQGATYSSSQPAGFLNRNEELLIDISSKHTSYGQSFPSFLSQQFAVTPYALEIKAASQPVGLSYSQEQCGSKFQSINCSSQCMVLQVSPVSSLAPLGMSKFFNATAPTQQGINRDDSFQYVNENRKPSMSQPVSSSMNSGNNIRSWSSQPTGFPTESDRLYCRSGNCIEGGSQQKYTIGRSTVAPIASQSYPKTPEVTKESFLMGYSCPSPTEDKQSSPNSEPDPVVSQMTVQHLGNVVSAVLKTQNYFKGPAANDIQFGSDYTEEGSLNDSNTLEDARLEASEVVNTTLKSLVSEADLFDSQVESTSEINQHQLDSGGTGTDPALPVDNMHSAPNSVHDADNIPILQQVSNATTEHQTQLTLEQSVHTGSYLSEVDSYINALVDDAVADRTEYVPRNDGEIQSLAEDAAGDGFISRNTSKRSPPVIVGDPVIDAAGDGCLEKHQHTAGSLELINCRTCSLPNSEYSKSNDLLPQRFESDCPAPLYSGCCPDRVESRAHLACRFDSVFARASAHVSSSTDCEPPRSAMLWSSKQVDEAAFADGTQLRSSEQDYRNSRRVDLQNAELSTSMQSNISDSEMKFSDANHGATTDNHEMNPQASHGSPNDQRGQALLPVLSHADRLLLLHSLGQEIRDTGKEPVHATPTPSQELMLFSTVSGRAEGDETPTPHDISALVSNEIESPSNAAIAEREEQAIRPPFEIIVSEDYRSQTPSPAPEVIAVENLISSGSSMQNQAGLSQVNFGDDSNEVSAIANSDRETGDIESSLREFTQKEPNPSWPLQAIGAGGIIQSTPLETRSHQLSCCLSTIIEQCTESPILNSCETRSSFSSPLNNSSEGDMNMARFISTQSLLEQSVLSMSESQDSPVQNIVQTEVTDTPVVHMMVTKNKDAEAVEACSEETTEGKEGNNSGRDNLSAITKAGSNRHIQQKDTDLSVQITIERGDSDVSKNAVSSYLEDSISAIKCMDGSSTKLTLNIETGKKLSDSAEGYYQNSGREAGAVVDELQTINVVCGSRGAPVQLDCQIQEDGQIEDAALPADYVSNTSSVYVTGYSSLSLFSMSEAGSAPPSQSGRSIRSDCEEYPVARQCDAESGQSPETPVRATEENYCHASCSKIAEREYVADCRFSSAESHQSAVLTSEPNQLSTTKRCNATEQQQSACHAEEQVEIESVEEVEEDSYLPLATQPFQPLSHVQTGDIDQMGDRHSERSAFTWPLPSRSGLPRSPRSTLLPPVPVWTPQNGVCSCHTACRESEVVEGATKAKVGSSDVQCGDSIEVVTAAQQDIDVPESTLRNSAAPLSSIDRLSTRPSTMGTALTSDTLGSCAFVANITSIPALVANITSIPDRQNCMFPKPGHFISKQNITMQVDQSIPETSSVDSNGVNSACKEFVLRDCEAQTAGAQLKPPGKITPILAKDAHDSLEGSVCADGSRQCSPVTESGQVAWSRLVMSSHSLDNREPLLQTDGNATAGSDIRASVNHNEVNSVAPADHSHAIGQPSCNVKQSSSYWDLNADRTNQSPIVPNINHLFASRMETGAESHPYFASLPSPAADPDSSHVARHPPATACFTPAPTTENYISTATVPESAAVMSEHSPPAPTRLSSGAQSTSTTAQFATDTTHHALARVQLTSAAQPTVSAAQLETRSTPHPLDCVSTAQQVIYNSAQMSTTAECASAVALSTLTTSVLETFADVVSAQVPSVAVSRNTATQFSLPAPHSSPTAVPTPVATISICAAPQSAGHQSAMTDATTSSDQHRIPAEASRAPSIACSSGGGVSEPPQPREAFTPDEYPDVEGGSVVSMAACRPEGAAMPPLVAPLPAPAAAARRIRVGLSRRAHVPRLHPLPRR